MITCAVASRCVCSATPLPAWPIPLSTPRESVSSPRESAPMRSSAVAPSHLLASRLLRWRRSQARVGSQVAVGQALADDGAQCLDEPSRVAVRIAPFVESKRLLIHIPMQMEGVHRDIGTTECPLEQAPKILKPVGVNMALDVHLGLVDNAVDVIVSNLPVRAQHVGDHFRPRLDVVANDRGEACRLDVRHYFRVNPPLGTVQQA